MLVHRKPGATGMAIPTVRYEVVPMTAIPAFGKLFASVTQLTEDILRAPVAAALCCIAQYPIILRQVLTELLLTHAFGFELCRALVLGMRSDRRFALIRAELASVRGATAETTLLGVCRFTPLPLLFLIVCVISPAAPLIPCCRLF